MNGRPPAIFFLSDYGTADEFVGVVHAVLHRHAPGVRVIDLSHQVAPFDVSAGAALLGRSAPHLGPGVVLAVVDPGVGTTRRAVAVATGVAPAGSGPAGAPSHRGPGWLVGPDNGLLVPAADALGGAVRVIELGTGAAGGRPTRPAGTGAARRRSGAREEGAGRGATFDGRDVFAPAAAHLVTGGDPAVLGPDVDPVTLAPAGSGRSDVIDGPPASPGPSAVLAPVTWVDRFGNAQLGLAPEALVTLGIAPGGRVRVAVQTTPRREGGADAVPSVPARWVRAFGELDPGELGLMTDANGSVALVLDRASAARRLGIAGRGTPVEIAADEVR